MVWNEPNNGPRNGSGNEPGKENDPWRRDRGQQPADIDEVVKNLQKRFGSLFGGNNSGGANSELPPFPGFVKFVLVAALVGAIFWACRFVVDAGSIGVVTRFGAFHREASPGWNWRIPVVDQVDIVRVDLSQEFDTKNEMLTGDANIISVTLNVQYRRALAKEYAFNVRDPDETLQEVTDAAIRAVVGKYDLEFIQREGRDQVARETREVLQTNLDRYGTGISVDAVNLTETEFPLPVQDAAQDVIKAARDKERYILQAEAYTRDLLPRAEGEAARNIEEANAYKEKLIADAKGEASRFVSLMKQYEAAPEVTRERLYLEAVEEVLENTSKVVMDTEGSGNLVYLPIDKLMEKSNNSSARPALEGANRGSIAAPPDASMQRPQSTQPSVGSRSRDR